MKKRNSKGLSPVIATTLLIAIVVVIGLIIFLWFRGMVGDYGEKFGKNIELVCEDVVMYASYYDGILDISNDGNVPIYKMNVKIAEEGGYTTKELGEFADWPETGLNQGGVFSDNVASEVYSAETITLIPILIGTSEKGNKKTFVCNERYGYEITL